MITTRAHSPPLDRGLQRPARGSQKSGRRNAEGGKPDQKWELLAFTGITMFSGVEFFSSD